jgi:membrane-associated protease RseP (regulator of RpoE activity)
MPNTLLIFILYLITILVLLLVLTIHEMGHFLFAKIYHVNIKEFSIGFGPKLWQRKTRKNMFVSLRLIPLMAYVILDSKMLRAMYKGDKKHKHITTRKPKSLHFLEDVNSWQYIQIMFGGVFLNLLTFFLVYIPIVCFSPWYASIPFTGIIDAFVGVGKNMVGIGQGDIFGQIPSLPDQVTTSTQWLQVLASLFMMINLLTSVFNTLPLPPLDGWKISKRVFENITHKKISERVESYISIAIVILMLWIFISGIVMDIVG